MNLAILYALAGDAGASLREAEAALTEAPDDRFIATNYIRLMVRGGRTDAAVRQMEAVVQKFPDVDSIQIWRGTPDELTTRLLEEVFLPGEGTTRCGGRLLFAASVSDRFHVEAVRQVLYKPLVWDSSRGTRQAISDRERPRESWR